MTIEEIDEWYVNELARQILKCDGLIPSDTHDEQTDAKCVPLMTSDRAFYFVPCYADCVRVTKWWFDQSPPVYQSRVDLQRPKWAVEVVKCCPGNRDEPDDFDNVEVARADSLIRAIQEASHYAHEQKLQSISDSVWCDKEILLQQHGHGYP